MQAVIDLGSNSAILTIRDGNRIVHDEAVTVGLGRGLVDGGGFDGERMEATLATLHRFASVARELGVVPARVIAVTTAAARRAVNAATYFDRVANETGLRFRVLSGDEEARRTFVGALSGLHLDGSRVLVVDLGGGSMELALGRRVPSWTCSLPLGCVRLTEAVLGSQVRPASRGDVQRIRHQVRTALGDVDLPERPARAVAVGGSATSLMSAELGQVAFDPVPVHGATLTASSLDAYTEALIGVGHDARLALFPAAPDRADHLLAASVVLREVLRWVDLEDGLLVSTRGLRYGMFVRMDD